MDRWGGFGGGEGIVATKSDVQLVEALEHPGHVLVTLTSFTTTRLDHLRWFRSLQRRI